MQTERSRLNRKRFIPCFRRREQAVIKIKWSKKVYFKRERDMISCNFSAMSLSRCNCSNDSIAKYVNQRDCIPYEKSALTTLFFINQHKISSLTQLWLTFLSAKQFPRSETHLKTTRKSMCTFCVRGTRTQLLISVLCPVQLIGEIFHLCRHIFASLWGASIRCASLWRAN